MQFNILITFIVVNNILHLADGQLRFDAIAGYGHGAENYMRIASPICAQLPCIPWISPDILSSGVDFSQFTENSGKSVLSFIGNTKKPKERRRKARKSSKKSDEFEKNSGKAEIRVRDAVRGGRINASLWTTPTTISDTSDGLSLAYSQESTTDVYGIEVTSPAVSLQNSNTSYLAQDQRTSYIEKITALNQNQSSAQNPNQSYPVQNQRPSYIEKITVQNQNRPYPVQNENSQVPIQNQNSYITDQNQNQNPYIPVQNQNPYIPVQNQNPYIPDQNQRLSSIGQITGHAISRTKQFSLPVQSQMTAMEHHAGAAIQLNKTFGRVSPLIQVYVIASGSGGAHTSIGEGGYHGHHNGQTNIDSHHLNTRVPEDLGGQNSNIGFLQGTRSQLQNSRERNPWNYQNQNPWVSQNRNPSAGIVSDINQEGDILENLSSEKQLNSENDEQNQKFGSIGIVSSATNPEFKQKVVSGAEKPEFRHYWVGRK